MEMIKILFIVTLIGQIPEQSPVASLNKAAFQQHIVELCSHGSRAWDQPGNALALDYVETELISFGYEVVQDQFLLGDTPCTNLYVDLPGTRDSIYIIGTHIDAFLTDVSAGADDNASGCALLLEMARVFAGLQPEYGIRFIFFNADADTLNGSTAYVAANGRSNVEGMINIDTILFDHESSDVNVDYADDQFERFAYDFISKMVAYRSNLSIAFSNTMCCTSADAFADFVPTLNISEQKHARILESNPYVDSINDIPSSYADRDYDFGFEITKMVVGVVSEITNAIPQLEPASWPAFVDCVETEGCVSFDLDANGQTDLRDVSIILR